jgi:hypothetical protein
MKYLKKFESFSHVNEELNIPGLDKLKEFYNSNKEAVNKFFAALNPDLKNKVLSTEAKPEEVSKIEAGLEQVQDIKDEEVVSENFLKKATGKVLKSVGVVAQIASGAGLAGSLIRASLADDGLVDRVKAFHPAGMPIGYFVAMCILVGIAGLIVNKVGSAIAK